MSTMKGQAAIEYLTQYGWMLLAAALVGSTVYTQIPTECSLDAQGLDENIKMVQIGINTDEELILSLRKRTPEPVEVKKITLNGSEEEINKSLSLSLESRNQKSTSLTQVERTEGCQKYRLTVVYDKGPIPSIKNTADLNIPVKISP